MAVWMPVTEVPRSWATVAMDTFMTELSSAMRNWPEARVTRMAPEAAPATATGAGAVLFAIGVLLPSSRPHGVERGLGQARALALSPSNSSGVIAPESSSDLALAIWSAGVFAAPEP